MENEKLLTVKQFADSVGMTQQGIYRQLNNKLKLYFEIVDGKKMIKADALKLFENKFNNDSTIDSEKNNDRIEQLNDILKTVKQQLSETIIKSEFKDETIVKQQEKIEMMKSENKILNDKLIEAGNQLADARARAEEREKIIDSLQTDKENLNNQIKDLKDIISKMQEDNAEVVISLKQLTTDKTKLEYQIQEYQKQEKISIFKRLFRK